MLTAANRRPLFADLGEIANAITRGVRHAAAVHGATVKAVHINPKMREVIDQLHGSPVAAIEKYPIVSNAKTPIDKFWLEKA